MYSTKKKIDTRDNKLLEFYDIKWKKVAAIAVATNSILFSDEIVAPHVMPRCETVTWAALAVRHG